MQKGNIGVTTENIFPIIKKFLYSDHEIFLREALSNAVDATQKLKALARRGEFEGEMGDTTIRISNDAEKKIITISDRGIGMTAEEVDKYINQIAFSSANEFLDKYKDDVQSIIGHFGLGFYSLFMVSEKVEIYTKSYKDDAKGVHWSCEGSPEYQLEEYDKKERGTDIVIHLDEESKEFAEESKINELLNKYAKFLPVPVAFGKEQEWKEDKMVDTDKDKIINNPEPAWTKKPADLEEKDYKDFYKELYPMGEDPLFHIHLNVDYPFNLTGILYFPKIRNNIEIQKNKIQLYCNQVFVTDSVEGIVPEFLTLLHGVIDSPDIPLNVSRSYLQSDSNVKKISSHITKKVADRLNDIFKEDRKQFEEKWDDLKIFIQYGMLTDEKFAERAKNFVLLKNTDGKYFTFDEYKDLIKEHQTDKDKKLVHLYTTNKTEQYTFIEEAKTKGYDVLEMDGQLDVHFVNKLETDLEDASFKRVDADVLDKLIEKEVSKDSKLSDEQQNNLVPVFRGRLPEDGSYIVSVENLDEDTLPIMITQSEFMRRMKDMSEMQGGANMYGNLPDSYNLVLNSNHPLIVNLASSIDEEVGDELKKTDEAIEPVQKEFDEISTKYADKKEEDLSEEDKQKRTEVQQKLDELKAEKEEKLKGFGKEEKLVKQLIDLGLLANNMLKGEDLNKFVKRSVELLEE
ncbi:MAG TPA: molecular chaperone HtpG [Salinivirga sp.]|uniref:molecular chaperone HtpG n=1 Tax=Salinivirga sp. TaxID=1970192 RepID=UPI002B4911F4|nr:molecular chaperone HtpG [Salinivirga sp.]HKK58202.1 molecular chaperone HtpG [Salinivirga sp.]